MSDSKCKIGRSFDVYTDIYWNFLWLNANFLSTMLPRWMELWQPASLNVVSSLSLSIRCKQLIAQEKLIKLKLFWHSLLFYLFIFSQRHISLILHPSKRVVVVTRTQAMVVTRALTIVVTRGTGRSGKWDYFDAKNVWSLIRFFSLFIKY